MITAKQTIKTKTNKQKQKQTTITITIKQNTKNKVQNKKKRHVCQITPKGVVKTHWNHSRGLAISICCIRSP